MIKENISPWIEEGKEWMRTQGWEPFPFQLQAWEAYLSGFHGIVNAPTGSGKTYSLFIPALLEAKKNLVSQSGKGGEGLQFLWITPLRALAKEIQYSGQRVVLGLGMDWEVGIRSGDTSSAERARQKKKPPQCMITTPESLHLLLAQRGYPQYFANLKGIVIDEWHELLGSKRGVQIELALSRLKGLLPDIKVWGISATIGNMDEAVDILLGPFSKGNQTRIIRADIKKDLEVNTVLPEEIDTMPWTGHLGITLLEQVIPLIHSSQSTLIFTNTRAQCEIWYQRLLEAAPDLAGIIAMHHGSISRELRDWVEQALHEGMLKAVVCTSSLDLGVDFRPVETVVQVGSPKGVARFLQRAGRSGHRPGARSRIYFVPTHSLELMEGSALREAIATHSLEQRIPYYRSFDVLLQYLMTLAVSEGFYPDNIYQEILQTFSYESISPQEWQWLLDFLITGGEALFAYDEYKKVDYEKGGKILVRNRSIAMRHRMSIGTIVDGGSLTVKFVRGGKIGTIEEWFVSQLKPGDIFWFAGRSLEFVRMREMTVQVRKSKAKKGKVPAWMGGRMSFSSQLSAQLRDQMDKVAQGQLDSVELKALHPLFLLQSARSHIPRTNEFLIEYFSSREGYHLLMYPFEGRAVHEGMGALMAYRLSLIQPQSFSIAQNDYGFELLSDEEIPLQIALDSDLFTLEGLREDIQASINSVEMARRRFRDIASISGLVFKGFPGRQIKDRHLQASSQLFFQVFSEHDPQNLLLRQAYDEVMTFQLDESRLRQALERIQAQRLIVSRPDRATPFSFPILVDRLRERLSSEKLEDRVKKMKVQMG
ncbi:MAG: ligase-associated DNA damage response DEXH box helicase [Bacteroidota bacterium]